MQQSNSDEFKIPKLTDFINSALLSRQITFEEHRDFRPLIDELVFYVHRWYYDCEESGKPQVIGLDDVLTLLKFAESFEVQDPVFLSALVDISEKSLETLVKSKNISVDSILELTSILKAGDLQSNRIMRLVNQLLFPQLKTMTTQQLSIFASIYVSLPMQAAIDIFEQGRFDSIRKALKANLSLFNQTEFSQICNAVAFSGNP